MLTPLAVALAAGWLVDRWAAAVVLLGWLVYRAVTRPRVLWAWSTQLARAGQERAPRRRGDHR